MGNKSVNGGIGQPEEDKVKNTFATVEISQPRDEDIIERCRRIAEEIEDEVKPLRVNRDHQSYVRLSLKVPSEVISACSSMPQTTISRDEFRNKYGTMHRGNLLWSEACNLFHQGESDPLRKTDSFLECIHILHSLWH